MQHFIAIDLGTTNCKAVVVDENLHIVHTNKIVINSILEDEGTHEQNADEIFQAVIKLVQQCIQRTNNNKIACVSFSAAMHSLWQLMQQANHS
jgi:gluconokinase